MKQIKKQTIQQNVYLINFILVSQSIADVTQNKSFYTDIETKTKKKNLKKNLINYPLFLESLAITAMSFKFNDRFTDIDKVIFLIINPIYIYYI